MDKVIQLTFTNYCGFRLYGKNNRPKPILTVQGQWSSNSIVSVYEFYSSMKRIVVFGKPASGKSTLSRDLSVATGLSLFPLDLIEYEKSGEKVSAELYATRHAELIASDSWIIEGLGSIESFWERVDAADTLIYVDLPYRVSYWWIVKRLLKSPLVKPLGWPKGSSVLKGTKAGFKYLKLSPKFWTSELYEKINSHAETKNIYRITSVKELNEFVKKF